MEITEYLNRINLKSADTTLFKKETKEVKLVREGEEVVETINGISTYTFYENGSAGVVGFLRYDKSFPDQVFSIDPAILSKILDLTDSIDIEDTFLVGKSKYGEIRRDLVLKKWRSVRAKYDNEPLTIRNEIIQRIVNTNEIVDSSYITLEGDGEKLTFTMFPKITNGEAKVVIPSVLKTSYRFDSTVFMEVLKTLGSNDAKFYMDVVEPEGRKKSPIKIELNDKNAQIEYYVTEAMVEVSQEKVEKKPVNEAENEEEEEEVNAEATEDGFSDEMI